MIFGDFRKASTTTLTQAQRVPDPGSKRSIAAFIRHFVCTQQNPPGVFWVAAGLAPYLDSNLFSVEFHWFPVGLNIRGRPAAYHTAPGSMPFFKQLNYPVMQCLEVAPC
eukprot:727225-Pelagomonas_calceolata.AAC.5